MGMYLDPGNESFKKAINSDIYIDKTGAIEVLNRNIGKERCYFAVSRARRFGKSMVAGMLDAYYSMGCNSKEMFAPFKISGSQDFEKHLNKYHVLHFDMATFLNDANAYRLKSESMSDHADDEECNRIKMYSNPINLMNDTILKDFRRDYPDLIDKEIMSVPKAIEEVWRKDGHQFVIIIDEWECVIRDAKEDENLILDYLKYLRGFFKTEESKQFVALGYITGILPIKKFDGESAMNNFTEYTMISPKDLAPYFGFTEEEVVQISAKDHYMDIEAIRKWYDGYRMSYVSASPSGRSRINLHMYNPNSLVEAFTFGECESYWKNTGAFGGLNQYISMNMDGLKDAIIVMLTGEDYPVDTSSYQNDLTSFKSKDDVLTALIHMGYLGYDPATKNAFIPNEEVRDVFESAIKVGEWNDICDALRKSDGLLRATWDCDSDKVAEEIAASHQDYTSILEYHDENSLALAIMMSYYTARKHYVVVREFPSGKGYADIVFIPKRGVPYPAMIVELKWNKTADGAINQIHNKNYDGKLKDYGGELLLVGIDYDKVEKRYTCEISRNK